MSIDKDLLIRWVRTGKKIETVYDRKLSSEGLTLTQLEVILCLCERSPLRQQDIVNELGVHRAAVVRLIGYLEQGGWVTRKENPGDERSHLISLTEKTKNRIVKIESILSKASEDYLYGVSHRDQSKSAEVLQRVLENMEQDL